MKLNAFGIPTGPACPDCNADIEPIDIAPNVTVMGIAHDTTCPAYRAMTQDNRP